MKLYTWLEEKEAILRIIVYARNPKEAVKIASECYPNLSDYFKENKPVIVSERFTISNDMEKIKL